MSLPFFRRNQTVINRIALYSDRTFFYKYIVCNIYLYASEIYEQFRIRNSTKDDVRIRVNKFQGSNRDTEWLYFINISECYICKWKAGCDDRGWYFCACDKTRID